MGDTLIVNPLIYTLAGSNLHTYAREFHKLFSTQMSALSGTGGMGGTAGVAKEWSASYDAAVLEVESLAKLLVEAMQNYSEVLQQVGYNYALADYEKGTGRPEPAEPVDLGPAWGSCSPPPPSAGGPGSGLSDEIGLAASVLSDFGVAIPDSDPDKLTTSAEVWEKLAGAEGAVELPELIGGIAQSFESETAPDISAIDEDLNEIKRAATDLVAAFGEIAAMCRNQADSIKEMRNKISGQLSALAADPVWTVSTNLVTRTVGGVVSAIFSAEAVSISPTLAISDRIKVFANTIAGLVTAIAFVARWVIKALSALGGVIRAALQRIKDLGRKIAERFSKKKKLNDLFDGRTPKASELETYAKEQGWVRSQTDNGPIKYTDENGVVRMTIKKGSGRAPGSSNPHVELRDSTGQRIDPSGNPVTRKSPGNHTPIDWDLN
ncbi:hypothetical protein [Nocardia mangyaensis]|uniref:hypothetical protein n=1 Tax=Nocardia mangyaensis TaxID=2213200 RepID=UPI001F0A54E7|nr:hypothetical protein [Nocardia mangyaensis]